MIKTFRDAIRTFGLLGLLVFCGWPEASAQGTQALQAPPAPAQEGPARLWMTVRDLRTDTTRIYQLCDSIMAQSDAGDLLHAYAEFLKFNTQKFFWFDTLPKRIAFLKSRQSHFLQSPHFEIRGIYYYMLGMALMRNYDFKEAFEMSFRARRIFEQIGYENIPIAAQILDGEFFTSYYFEDYRAAIHYSVLAEKYNTYGTLGVPYILSNRGEAYLRLGDYPNAEKMFLRAMGQAEALGKTPSLGVSSGNYGKTLRLQGKHREALPHLYRDVALNERDIPRNSAATCLEIAYCLIELDSMRKANAYLNRAERLIADTKMPPDWHWGVYGADFFKTLYYEVKSRYYAKTANYDLSLRYKDSLIVLKDTLARRFDDKILLKAEAQQAAENYLRRIEKIEQEKVNALNRRNSIVAAIVAVALLLLYLLNYRRRREKQVQELEKKRAEDLLAHANEQLAQYVENIKSKNALIEKMSADLADNEAWVPEPADAEKHIEELRHQVILTEEGWGKFKELFERVYPNFFEHLEAESGVFSPAEIRLLALLKLNLDSKEAAYLLGISTESLRKARYRLRKKVEQLPTTIQLAELIEPF